MPKIRVWFDNKIVKRGIYDLLTWKVEEVEFANPFDDQSEEYEVTYMRANVIIEGKMIEVERRVRPIPSKFWSPVM